MRRVLTAVVVLVIAVVTAGCGVDFKDPVAPVVTDTPIEVTGAADVPPTLEFDTPLVVGSESSRVVWPGAGAPLVDGGDVLLNMYAEDGRTKAIVQDTYVGSPRLLRMDPADLGTQLYEALRDQHVGARLLLVSNEKDTVTDEGGTMPLVLTVDVLPSAAYGTAVAAPKGSPKVTVGEDGIPRITVPKSDPPLDLGVHTLIRGTGEQVEPGNLVTVRFTGVRWSDGKQFDTNWDTGSVLTAVFGVGTVVQGWEQGLLEQSVGSRVLLVVPPSLGYGGTASPLADETLVYVVDILDTRSTLTQDNSTGEGAAPGTEEG